MPSVFSKIVKGEIPCHKVAEDERFLAFLDIRPLKRGHTLVIPKVEIDYYFDLPDELLGDMMVFAKKVAKAIEKQIKCERIGVLVAGLEVPHAHIHLIPIDDLSDIKFAHPPLLLSAEEMGKIAADIHASF